MKKFKKEFLDRIRLLAPDDPIGRRMDGKGMRFPEAVVDLANEHQLTVQYEDDRQDSDE